MNLLILKCVYIYIYIYIYTRVWEINEYIQLYTHISLSLSIYLSITTSFSWWLEYEERSKNMISVGAKENVEFSQHVLSAVHIFLIPPLQKLNGDNKATEVLIFE